jgi:DsbC/DsbD-like thiol-disulfide interchange protein
MRCIPLRVFFFNALLCFFPALSSAAVSAPHLTVDLIAENASIAPGHSFQAGLKFNLEKSWHVYWINPGDSGEPPKVEWKLPAGFQADPIEWPTPARLPISKLMDYGYEDQVLLMMRIHPPVNLKPGTTIQLAATVKWLVCREVCIPGHGDVSLTLPVSSETPKPSAHQDLFIKTKASLPLPAPRSWRQSIVAGKDDFVLTLRTGKLVKSVVFFPLEAEQIENAAPQQVHSDPTGVRIDLKKSEQLLKPITRLRGVVVLDGRGYEVNAPVVSRAGQSSAP